MASLRDDIIRLVAGRSARAIPLALGLLVLSLAVLLVLGGVLGAPAVRGPAFDWAERKPAALAAADGPAYAKIWQGLDERPYPALSDHLADQLQANRANAAEALAEGTWQGGALDGASLRLKGRAIAGTENDIVQRWTQDHLCPAQGWGASTRAVRALVARGLGECSFLQRWQARAPAFAIGGLGWLWLGLSFAFFILCLTVFGALFILRGPYAWLYKSRVL